MKKLFRRYVALTLAMIMLFACAADAFAATLTLPKNLKAIEPEAFHGATALDEVVLPEGITAIGSRAFADSSLKSINLPRSLTSIADDAFENSPNLTAIVKAGSYAQTYCEEHDIAHEVETVVPPTPTSVPVSVSTTMKTLAMGEEALELTFSSDNGAEMGEDEWYHYSIVFLNADGEVIDADNYGENGFGTWSYRLECAGAAKIVITIVKSEYGHPGAHPSVTVDVTGSESYVYYDWDVQGNGYPGGTMRFTLVAKNADKMTGAQTVTITDEQGSFTKTGTISASNPKYMTDFTVPSDWQCYNENGEFVDYRLKCTIGDRTRYYYVNVEPLIWEWTDAPLGRSMKLEYRIIPSEMPYTFSVEDPSIATIDDAGYVTGVTAGRTTGTLTTKNGVSYDFTIDVLGGSSSGDEPEASPSEPVFYVIAASDSIMEGEDDAETFYICSEVENSLLLDEELEYILRFYDKDGELIEEIWDYRWINHDDRVTLWSDWSWWYDFVEPGQCASIEFAFGDTDYEVTEPSTARISVVNPEDLGKLSFSMGENWGYHSVGDTVTIPLTCTTPNLLAQKGSATVKPVVLYSGGLDIIRDVQVASFDADTLTANVSFTVGEDVLPGAYYNIHLYCGADKVGQYNVEVFSGLARTVYEFEMAVGESRKLPIYLANGGSYDNLYIDIVGDPSVVSIDSDGTVTALKSGWTEVSAYYDCGYGQTYEEWFEINVYDTSSETPPTLTVTQLGEAAVYGGTLPVKAQLSAPIEGDYGDPYVGFRVNTYFLDKNRNVLVSNGRYYDYPSQELAEGVTLNLNLMTGGTEIYRAEYVYIVPGYADEVSPYMLDFDTEIIPLTGVPEPGEVFWSFEIANNSEISQGDWVDLNVQRLPQEIGYDVEMAVCDEDGNVLRSGTYWDGDWNCYLGFSTSGFDIGEHTVYLYVDGEKLEGVSVTFTIAEPAPRLSNISSRLGIGSSFNADYYYEDSDYDCEVTFSSSNPEVASVTDGNRVTALATGQTVLTATCAHGKSADTVITVYNPSGTVTPELYIAPYEDQRVEWMGYLEMIFGTQDDILQIPYSSLQMNVNVQLLDEDGDVLYDQYEDDGWYHRWHYGLHAQECSLGWDEEDVWELAAQLGARYICFALVENTDEDWYTVDPDRNAVTYELPPLSTYRYPIVTVDYPQTIPTGGTIDVTFTCQNPNSLTRSREVLLYDNYGDVLVSDYLTSENPIVTLSYDPGEDFTGGYFQYCYPTYESGSRTRGFNVRVSSYNGLGYDVKMGTGDTRYMYPDYSGSMPMLTVTSSDESVATAELYGSYAMNGMARDGGYVIVTGVGAGTATITGTDQYGVSHSFKVVVYDYNNSINPVLGIDQSQCGEVQWESGYRIALVTDNEPHTFGSPSMLVQMDYLDAEGNVLYSTSTGVSAQDDFLEKTDEVYTYIDVVKMAQLYGQGARSILFTLIDNDYSNYDVDESAATVTATIADPNESEEPIIIHTYPTYSIKGGTYDVSFTCLNPASLGDGVLCTVKGEKDPEKLEFLLTPDNPAASATLSIPADYANDSRYYLYINVGSNGYSYNVPLLRGTISTPRTLSIGSTWTVSKNLYTYGQGLTEVWASSNENVATIDQSGMVTAVAPGQSVITLTYGPLVLTTGVRVYDWNEEHATPELYITADTSQEVKTGTTVSYSIGTNTDPAELGSSVSFTYKIDYLNDDGEVVGQNESRYGDSAAFALGREQTYTRSIYNELVSFVAAGATQVRFSLVDESSYYTVDPSRASVVFPIMDPSQWGNNEFGLVDSGVYHGDNTLHVKMVSTWNSYVGKNCLLTLSITDQDGAVLLDNATATVSTANPDAYFDFNIPESVTSVSCSLRYQFENSGTSTSYIYPKLVTVTQTQADTTIAIGSTMDAYYSGNNLSAVRRSYESSNPAIATVNNDGVVTGISAGVATITAHIGKLEYSFKVRVYDEENAVHANLSLSVPEDVTEWSWSGEGDLIITADQPIENLGSLTQVTIISNFSKEGGYGHQAYSYPKVSLIDSNSVVVHLELDRALMASAAANGFTHIEFELDSFYGSGFSINWDESVVTLPMQDLADYPDPMLSVDPITFANMFCGRTYRVSVHAVNDAVSAPATVAAYTFLNGKRYDMGSITFTPSESADVELVITAPSDVTTNNFYLRVVQLNEDGTETQLSGTYHSLREPPETVMATSLAELQSDHPYANNMSKMWMYTVEGATKLDITFDGRSATESSHYDPLKVGSLAAVETNAFEYTLGGSINAVTIFINSDTAVFWLKSDGSVNDYGFSVTKIVATMADGSTVTITE